jgi:hypothetical protein
MKKGNTISPPPHLMMGLEYNPNKKQRKTPANHNKFMTSSLQWYIWRVSKVSPILWGFLGHGNGRHSCMTEESLMQNYRVYRNKHQHYKKFATMKKRLRQLLVIYCSDTFITKCLLSSTHFTTTDTRAQVYIKSKWQYQTLKGLGCIMLNFSVEMTFVIKPMDLLLWVSEFPDHP